MELSSLLLGEEALITKLNASGTMRRKLMEMGLLTQTKVKFVGAAPFGDPLEYEVRGYRISLRKEEAAQIEVKAL